MSLLSDLSSHDFRELRLNMFTVQRRAAEAMGVTHETLSRWERGRRPIPRWAEELLKAWSANGRQRV